MSQTAQHIVLDTLAYLATVDLTPILPQITTPALVMVGGPPLRFAFQARLKLSVRRQYDDDLHPRPQPWWSWGQESGRFTGADAVILPC